MNMENVIEFPHGLRKGEKLDEICIGFTVICKAGEASCFRISTEVVNLEIYSTRIA